jgi:hypothetical protein
MDADLLSRLGRFRRDLRYYAPQCLKVRSKEDKIEPFVLNSVQEYVDAKLDAQKAEFGWVRALILKGRQQGVSTYVAARYYNRASMNQGVNVYILTHEQVASDTLFGMVDRFQRNNPIAPAVTASNAKELEFGKLDSTYAVATAGTKAGGRGKAISLFHGSEVAFWQNAGDHFSAAVQGVPLARNTEIILESTSAGAGGEFYERCIKAEAGIGDYQFIFLPWWQSAEYARELPAGFVLSDEAAEGDMSEQEYADTYKLSLSQMAWRRGKVEEIGASLFRREYPAEPAEAWTAPPGHEPFIAPLHIIRARRRRVEPIGPLILGVDPASNGGDRFSIAARRGNCVMWVRHRNKVEHAEAVAWIKSVIDELDPARVNIDLGNIGAAIVSSLKALGPRYATVIRGVNFGATSEAKTAKPKVPGPANRRAEMWMRTRDWLQGEEPTSVPDDPALQTDLTAPKLRPRINGDFVLESKDDMKRRGVKSPDLGDAVVLTFASAEYFPRYSEVKKASNFGDIDQGPVIPHNVELPMLPTGWMGVICLGLLLSQMLSPTLGLIA